MSFLDGKFISSLQPAHRGHFFWLIESRTSRFQSKPESSTSFPWRSQGNRKNSSCATSRSKCSQRNLRRQLKIKPRLLRNKRNLEGEHAELPATSFMPFEAACTWIFLQGRRHASLLEGLDKPVAKALLVMDRAYEGDKIRLVGKNWGLHQLCRRMCTGSVIFATVRGPIRLRPRMGCRIQTGRFPASRFLG